MPWKRKASGWMPDSGSHTTSRHWGGVGRWEEGEELNPLGAGYGKQSLRSLELRQTTLGRPFSELKLSEDTGRRSGVRRPTPKKGPYGWCLFHTRCCH